MPRFKTNPEIKTGGRLGDALRVVQKFMGEEPDIGINPVVGIPKGRLIRQMRRLMKKGHEHPKEIEKTVEKLKRLPKKLTKEIYNVSDLIRLKKRLEMDKPSIFQAGGQFPQDLSQFLDIPEGKIKGRHLGLNPRAFRFLPMRDVPEQRTPLQVLLHEAGHELSSAPSRAHWTAGTKETLGSARDKMRRFLRQPHFKGNLSQFEKMENFFNIKMPHQGELLAELFAQSVGNPQGKRIQSYRKMKPESMKLIDEAIDVLYSKTNKLKQEEFIQEVMQSRVKGR